MQAPALQTVASAGFCFKQFFHVFENDKYMTGELLAQKKTSIGMEAVDDPEFTGHFRSWVSNGVKTYWFVKIYPGGWA